MSDVTRAEICAVACADLFEDDGEILASPMGTMPLIGALYGLFTLDSAIQHWRGRGGMWKGRAQAMEKA